MKRAFSGAKQPMNNEKRGKIRPPNLFLYLILIPKVEKSKDLEQLNFITSFIMQEPTNTQSRIITAPCSPLFVRRVAAMLDLEAAAYTEGNILPRGWHFFMLAGETRKSSLRPDGFSGLGIPIPELGLPRLLLGSRNVSYQGDIAIGSMVERTSFVKDIVEKTTTSGRMGMVTIHHELRPVSAPNPAIIETQTYILLGEKSGSQPAKESTNAAPIEAEYQKQVVPDETHLFQYSALGFNSHKIHLDKNYAREVEMLPDLVVNGGLATLFLTEFLRTELNLCLTEIKVKHLSPLFCNRPMTLAVNRGEGDWQLKIYDDKNQMTVVATAKTIDTK
jgi:3-methylfumaryl-CoA hydratase